MDERVRAQLYEAACRLFEEQKANVEYRKNKATFHASPPSGASPHLARVPTGSFPQPYPHAIGGCAVPDSRHSAPGGPAAHAICVYDLDRLSRKLAHQLLLSEEFEPAGVALRIVTITVQATAIEPVVWEAVEWMLNNPALIAAKLQHRREGTSAQQIDLDHERHHSARQIAQCEKNLMRWEAVYLIQAIDVADFKAKKAEEDARRTSAERELNRLDEQQCLIERADPETASLMEYCARVRSELQHFTLDEKRRALEMLDLTVIWHPDKPPEMYGSIPVTIVSNAPQ